MTYDPHADARKSYDMAIRELRLAAIREGKAEPNMQDREERTAYNRYQINKGIRAYWARRRRAKHVEA